MKASVFLKNTLKFTVPSIVSAIVTLAVVPLVSRVFPTEEFGKINNFYSVGNIALYVFLLGLDSAYIRFFYEEKSGINKKSLFSLAFWNGLIVNVLVTAIVFFFFSKNVSGYLFGEDDKFAILYLGLFVSGLIVFRLISIESRMDGRAVVYNIQQIALTLITKVSYVVIAFFSTRYTWSIFFIGVATLVASVLFLIISKKKASDFALAHFSRPELSKIYKFAIPFMPTAVMTWLNNSLSKLILSGYGDFNNVGIIAIATTMANVFSLIPAAFCVYWSPFIYANHEKENAFIRKVHNYILLFSIVCVLGIVCFQDILYLFVGADYKTSQMYFMIIMLAPIQSLLCETTYYGIVLSNKTKYNLLVSLLGIAVNVGLGIWFYNFLGVLGVAISIGVSAVIQLVLKTVIGQKFYVSIENKWKTAFGFLLIIAVAFSNIWAYNNWYLRAAIIFFGILLTCVVYRKDISSFLKFVFGKKKREVNS